MALNSLGSTANGASSVLVSTLRSSAIVLPLSQVLDVSDGGMGNALWDLAGARPSLDLDFATTKSLADLISGQNLITFGRAGGTATYVDATRTIVTAAANEPRFTHDPVTGESLGLLLEELRTNLLLDSGTLSTQSVNVTAVAHTLSFTGTGTITLTGTSTAGPLVGAGTGEANRVKLTFTPTAGSLTLTVSGTVSNAQLEVGANPTSYIPTTGTQATRNADVATITGAAFSSWYRQTEGTLLIEWAMAAFPNTGGARVFELNSPSGTDIIWGRVQGGTNRVYDVTAGGVSQASLAPGAYTAGQSYRSAIAYKANDFAFSENGGIATDVAGSVPLSIDRLGIGCGSGGGSQGNLAISRLAFFPQRLTKLQAITA